MADISKAKSKAKTFTDIRNRDVEARAAFDPRFDKRITTNEEPIKPVSAPDTIVTPVASKSGKAATPPAAPAVVEALPATTTEPIEFDPQNALFYGDSIATGLGHGGARGDENSDARWGRGAARTLALMNSRPEGTFRDQDVVLSTGILNSGADWDTVRAQVNFLNGRGARSVRLVGVPNTDRYAGWNDQLQSIADETGSIFLGGYDPGSDGVHFNYSTYPVFRR